MLEDVFDRSANLGTSFLRPPELPRSQIKRKKMKNIFVGNLSFQTTEQDVRSLFEAHGSVDRVNIVTDRESGQPRGFGFVEMTNDAEGNKAIGSINGRDVDGRSLTVNEAKPKSEGGIMTSGISTLLRQVSEPNLNGG